MNKDLCLLMFFYLHRKETIGMGCSQAVRQRFLVACTVGSNPTTPAIFFIIPKLLQYNLSLLTFDIQTQLPIAQLNQKHFFGEFLKKDPTCFYHHS